MVRKYAVARAEICIVPHHDAFILFTSYN